MTPAIDLHDLSYLRSGTPRQREAYEALLDLGLFADLRAYTPTLAGTIPLDVEVEDSDLDVICQASDLTEFSDCVRSLYNYHDELWLNRQVVRGVDSVVAGFFDSGFRIELFAQDVPVEEQYACLHLLVEERLLRLAGDPARDAIRELKRQGMKTEPAFARYFGIAGDPYDELARLARATDDQLRALVPRGG